MARSSVLAAPSSRDLAYGVLHRYEMEKGPLRLLLDDALEDREDVPGRDRAFCRELVYGTVRRINTLDWALDLSSRPPVEKLSPAIRVLLRLGAYQLLYMAERVPPYAAVNESVDLAKRHAHVAAASFVNGVLRSLERRRGRLPWPDPAVDPVQAMALRHSHPAWLVRRWLDRWGEADCWSLLGRDNEPAPLCLRVNTLAASRAEVVRDLIRQGFPAELSRVSEDGLRLRENTFLADLPGFRRGAFLVQDDASQLAVQALDPRPGEAVLDLCAGVGGKSTHIAQRMEDRGTVTAVDTSAERLRRLKENCARLGARSVRSLLMDARQVARDRANAADRVLVDAPCSGLGVLRRRPDIRWNREGERTFKTFAAVQGELLRAAAACLTPGGVLVYAVCSTEPEESDQVAAGFLSEDRRFRADPPPLPPAVADALTPEGYVRLLPHRHDTDGFFIARFRKASA